MISLTYGQQILALLLINFFLIVLWMGLEMLWPKDEE